MAHDIFAIRASSKCLRDLVRRFPTFFAEEVLPESLHVPPGWLDVLELALRDAASGSADIHVRNLRVRSGILTADFTSGEAKPQKAFQELLAQTDEYCPCCGNLWDPCAKKRAEGA